jgi:AraC-like DNA-binding protein
MISFAYHGHGPIDSVNRIGPVTFPHFDLFVLRAGEVTLTFMGRNRLRLSRGQAVLIYPRTPFIGASVPPVSRCSVMHFRIDRRGSLSQPFSELEGRSHGFLPFLKAAPEHLESDVDRAIAMAEARQTDQVLAMRQALLTLILSSLRVGGRPPADGRESPSRFDDLITWLRTRLDEEVPVSAMAERVNLSPSRFHALFTANFGSSPRRYHFTMRMYQAQTLLIESASPVKEIARRVGYHDVPHFYRAFKKYCKVAPMAYRSAHGHDAGR